MVWPCRCLRCRTLCFAGCTAVASVRVPPGLREWRRSVEDAPRVFSRGVRSLPRGVCSDSSPDSSRGVGMFEGRSVPEAGKARGGMAGTATGLRRGLVVGIAFKNPSPEKTVTPCLAKSVCQGRCLMLHVLT
jgi:hypothetical protein